MAKVIVDKQERVVKPWWDQTRIIVIGAGLGLGWWVLAALLNRYVIEPLACRDISVNASACVDSYGVAGNVALILISLIGLIILIRGLHRFPVVISIASTALLWGLGGYLSGLSWIEALGWSVFLFAAVYGLFSLVTRLRVLGWVLIASLVIVVAIRLLLLL